MEWLDQDDEEEEEEEEEEENKESFFNQKRVTFNLTPQVHILYKWNTAYKIARQTFWETFARDRFRFKKRIEETSIILSRVFDEGHRNKIFCERFYNYLNK